MLKKEARVKVYGVTGTVIDFVPRPGCVDTFDAMVQTDSEISFDGISGNILVLRLNIGNEWGADHDVLRTVTVFLCPNADSWFRNSVCVTIDSHLVYEVLN
jgi:hypothetical protein